MWRLRRGKKLVLEFLPELPLNLVLWLNLGTLIIVLLALVIAYRKEDITERRFRILAQNYDSLLAEKILRDMEEEDPERAKELAEKIRAKLPKMPEGTPRVMMNPGKTNPQETPLETLLMLDRFRKTKDGGGAEES